MKRNPDYVVVYTFGDYRILEAGKDTLWEHYYAIETKDGEDLLGAQRWRSHSAWKNEQLNNDEKDAADLCGLLTREVVRLLARNPP